MQITEALAILGKTINSQCLSPPRSMGTSDKMLGGTLRWTNKGVEILLVGFMLQKPGSTPTVCRGPVWLLYTFRKKW